MATQVQLKPAQTRTHAGHSHGHAGHQHDNTFLTSKNKNDPGVRITRIGLYVNVGMAISKGIGGYVFNSQALIADAIHSLTDLISDLTTLATISYSLRPATARFPIGYGKIESLGALAVSGILLSGGLMIGLQAVMALSQQFFPEIAHFLSHFGLFLHSHDHSHTTAEFGPNINAAWLAAGSIAIKEWLYRATMKVAVEKRSSVLAGNAYHHRVDSLTAVVALLTITASHWLTNAQWLDPVGGLVIAGMIVQAGVGNMKAGLLELSDVAIDEEVQHSVENAAYEALGGELSSAPVVQGTKSGQHFLIEVAVVVPVSWTVGQTKELEDKIRHNIALKVKGIKRVSVRFTTEEGTKAFADEFVALDKDGTQDADPDHEHDHDKHEHKK